MSRIWFCVLLLFGARLCGGRLTEALVLPHGDLAWFPDGADPPLNATQHAQAVELQQAALAAGRWLAAEARPDLVLLTTPHGMATSRDTALFVNTAAAGCLDPAAAWHAAQAGLCGSGGVSPRAAGAPCPCSNVTVDADASLSLLAHFEDRWAPIAGSGCCTLLLCVHTELAALHCPTLPHPCRGLRRTTGLSGFGPPGQAEAPLALGWGEVIPLAFLPGACPGQPCALLQAAACKACRAAPARPLCACPRAACMQRSCGARRGSSCCRFPAGATTNPQTW